MALIARLFVVLFACLVAGFAAGAVITVAALMPTWSELFVDPLAAGAFAWVTAIAALFLSFVAFLPWTLVVIFAESLTVRSALFYAACGGAVASLTYMHASGWNTLALSVQGFARRELEIVAAAGIVGGLVYWALAGRNAGAWRKVQAAPEVPPPVQ